MKKRTRCRICKKRVNLKVNIDRENKRFYSFCPNCGGHGDVRLITKK